MRHLSNIFVALVSFLLALAGLDGYLQLAEIQTPMETRIDATLGPAYIPGKKFSRFSEGFFLGEANAYGYMGPAVPPIRRNGERRILLLGDSYLLGHTVFPRHHFARTLEQQLSRLTSESVQALNFGKADFDLQDMYSYFRGFAGTFEHDLALFFVDERDLVPVRRGAPGLQPTLKEVGVGLVIDRSFRNSPEYRAYLSVEPMLMRSAVLRLAFNLTKVVHRGEFGVVLLGKFAPASPPNDIGPPVAPVIPEIGRSVLRDLGRDPRNVLVVQDALPPLLLEEVRKMGLPMLDLGAVLAERKAQGEDPYYWPVTKMRGHWNHATHGVIAGFLAQDLARRGLLWPTGPSSSLAHSH